MSAEPASVASRAVRAGLWTVGTRLGAKLVDLAMLLCLARFLGPAEFGLVAMAMAAVFIVEALFELPMAAALIRVPTLTPALLHTAFTLSLLRGLVIALLLLALAWPMALFDDEPRLKGLLAVLALAPALRGLVSPRMVEFARAFNFRPDAVLELSGKAVAFVVSVAIAVSTGSYWALAAATVCGPLVSTSLSYWMAPLRPVLTLVHWDRFSNLIGWNFLSQLGAALNWQIDRLLLPRLTSNAAFGQYAIGKQLSEIPLQAMVQPLARPAMAALALAAHSPGARYLQLSHAVAVVMIPVFGLPLLWPEMLIQVALGPAWLVSAEWLRWLSVVALVGLPAVLMGPLVVMLDRTRWAAVRTLTELAFRVPLVWLGAVHLGIPGAIAGSALATAAGTLTSLLVVRHLIGIGPGAQLMMLRSPALAMLPAAALLWFAKPAFGSAGGLQLLAWAPCLVASYLLVYLAAIGLGWHRAGRPAGLEQHVVDAVRHRFKRLRRPPTDPASHRPATSNITRESPHAEQLQ